MLNYHAPLSIFGNIVLKSKGNEFNTFNIKEALIPIVSFARIYAIKHQIASQNTLERLDELSRRQIISEETYNEISYAYNYLMRLRIQHQQQLINDNKEPNNNIDPKELTNIDRTTLKKVFNQIQSFQNKLKIDFLGGRGL
jgi:CBS domain-containing protein